MIGRYFHKNVTFVQIIFIILTSLFLFNCSGTHERNLEDLDKIYGYCDNPHRKLGKTTYQICKSKELARGPDGKEDEMKNVNLTDLFDKFSGNSNSQTAIVNVNPFLWRASLDVTKEYDLKFADNPGGYIQTEWIYKSDNPNKRCMIKIQINSIELRSDSVETRFICEDQVNSIWVNDNLNYISEEKKLTLKVLELAFNYSYEK